jgi:Putative lumazine-binding
MEFYDLSEMKAILFFSLLGLHSISWSQSDSSDHIAVRAAIDQLFDGMRAGDSSLVRAVFHPELRLISTSEHEGSVQLHEGSAEDFLMAIGTAHEEVWDERISNVVIHVSDGLAQGWMDFAFYLDDRLNHSGVNAFQLVKTDSGWKIIHLMDTHRSNR